MQFQFRADNGDYLVFNLQLGSAPNDPSGDGTAIVKAAIADSKLSHFTQDDLLDLAGEIVDHFSSPVSSGPAPDWYQDEFLPATVAHERNPRKR